MNVNYTNAVGLPERLFPDVDFDSNEARYYETLNNIAIAVAEYRFSHNLTQTALADIIGVTQAMISKYESGDYNISLKAVFELFEKLGLRFSCTIEDTAKENCRPMNNQELSMVSAENFENSIVYPYSNADVIVAA